MTAKQINAFHFIQLPQIAMLILLYLHRHLAYLFARSNYDKKKFLTITFDQLYVCIST